MVVHAKSGKSFSVVTKFCSPMQACLGVLISASRFNHPFLENTTRMCQAGVTCANLQPGRFQQQGLLHCIKCVFHRCTNVFCRCGEHLQDQLVWCEGHVLGWKQTSVVSEPQSLTAARLVPGLSHGLSGCILALRRLYAFTGET